VRNARYGKQVVGVPAAESKISVLGTTEKGKDSDEGLKRKVGPRESPKKITNTRRRGSHPPTALLLYNWGAEGTSFSGIWNLLRRNFESTVQWISTALRSGGQIRMCDAEKAYRKTPA